MTRIYLLSSLSKRVFNCYLILIFYLKATGDNFSILKVEERRRNVHLAFVKEDLKRLEKLCKRQEKTKLQKKEKVSRKHIFL